MCLHEAEESHQHYLRQKVCGASRTTMQLHLALCCSREPAASLYITLIRSDLYQFNEFNACAQVSVCLCVCVGVCALCTASLGALHVQSKGWSRGRVSVVLLSWTCVLQKETQSTSPTVQYPFFGKMHCCPESLALSSNRIYSKPRMVLYKSVFALIGKLVRSRPSSLVISRFCLSTCSGRKIEDLWGP